MFATGDEVRERVLFVSIFAVEVPASTQLAAAANVGDRHDEAPIQQRKAHEAERRVDTDLVATVAV